MFIISTITCIRLFLTIGLLLVEVIGDKLSNLKIIPWTYRAVLDNAVHGLIAFLNWLIVVEYRDEFFRNNMIEALICGGLGSLLDIDHFVEAKSFRLKDAMNLMRRPPFHSTSLLILLWLAMIVMSILLSSWRLWRFAWIFLVAGLSHHIRDGIRHGLWFYPFGSTAPLPYRSYLLITAILPHVIRITINFWHSPITSHYLHVSEV